jgi:3-deoxy-7-phosphoheptulonate synthase
MLQTQNIRVARVEPLVPPSRLRAELPASDAEYAVVVRARATIRDIIAGRDVRLIAVVGPCSIHDPEAALEYAGRLAGLARDVADTMFVVMRVYFEKPRTTIGWKGLINDPHLDGTNDMQLGLRLARRLLLDVARLGLPAGTELLDPIVPQYVTDLISWSAVGARTTESQTHREMASGLSMPVGFKNSTDGNLGVAVNAMESARHPHTFLGIDADGASSVIHTTGNPDGHVILRGGRVPNYDADSLRACESLLRDAGLPSRLMVDCSHAQTGKDYAKQPEVLADVVRQVRAGGSPVMGFMLESNLGAGSQPLHGGRDGLAYGISITDGCIDWPTTERCLGAAAAALHAG